MRIDAHPMRIGRCIRMANPKCYSLNITNKVKPQNITSPVKAQNITIKAIVSIFQQVRP